MNVVRKVPDTFASGPITRGAGQSALRRGG